MEPFRELGGSRTHNRLIRSQGLYPIELLVHRFDDAKVHLFSIMQAKNVIIFHYFQNMLIYTDLF